MIFKQNGTRGRTWAGSVGLLAAALITGGCGSKAKETATASEANPSTAVRTEGTSAAGKSVTTPTEVRSGDVDLLQNLAVGASATNVAFLEADKAWQEFRASMRPPSPPVAWETNQPGKAVIEAFQKESGLKAEGVAEKAREFYTRYPKHEMAPEAQEREQYFLGIAAQYGNTNVLARMTLLEDAKLKDPATPEEDRLQVRVNRLQRSLMTGSETNLGSRVQMLEKEARLLMKDFPAHAELGGLLLAAATQWLELGDLEKARKLATEISENGESPDVKANASNTSPNSLFVLNNVTNFTRGVFHDTPAVPTFTCNNFANNLTGVYLSSAATNGSCTYGSRMNIATMLAAVR